MTTHADRMAEIRARLDAKPSTMHRGIAAQVVTDADMEWLLRRYEDARERLERIGSVEPVLSEDDGGCAWCYAYGPRRVKRVGSHDEDCPWRIAREHLEAE